MSIWMKYLSVNSFPKALSFLSAVFSFTMLVYGFYGESYWMGLGLVLFTTSLLLILGLSEADRVNTISAQEELYTTRVA